MYTANTERSSEKRSVLFLLIPRRLPVSGNYELPVVWALVSSLTSRIVTRQCCWTSRFRLMACVHCNRVVGQISNCNVILYRRYTVTSTSFSHKTRSKGHRHRQASRCNNWILGLRVRDLGALGRVLACRLWGRCQLAALCDCTLGLVRLAGVAAEEGKFAVMLETKLALALHCNEWHNFAWHVAYLWSIQLLMILAQISTPLSVSYDFDSPL